MATGGTGRSGTARMSQGGSSDGNGTIRMCQDGTRDRLRDGTAGMFQGGPRARSRAGNSWDVLVCIQGWGQPGCPGVDGARAGNSCDVPVWSWGMSPGSGTELWALHRTMTGPQASAWHRSDPKTLGRFQRLCPARHEGVEGAGGGSGASHKLHPWVTVVPQGAPALLQEFPFLQLTQSKTTVVSPCLNTKSLGFSPYTLKPRC